MFIIFGLDYTKKSNRGHVKDEEEQFQHLVFLGMLHQTTRLLENVQLLFNEFKIISLLVICGLLPIVGAFLTWKHAAFFLAKRDYYVNSNFDLLKKKLSMSLGVAGAIIFLTIMVASSLTDKNKKQIEKKIQMLRKK